MGTCASVNIRKSLLRNVNKVSVIFSYVYKACARQQSAVRLHQQKTLCTVSPRENSSEFAYYLALTFINILYVVCVYKSGRDCTFTRCARQLIPKLRCRSKQTCRRSDF